MPRNSLPALLMLAGLGWSQNPPPAPDSTPSADEKPAMVEGTVTNALTGEPLLHAHVTLRGMAGGGTRRNLSALTDAEGKFSLTVPAGSYTAVAERVGFTGTADRPGRFGTEVVVRAGDRKEDLKLKLNPTGAITGRVADADGEPVEGITVSAEGGTGRGGFMSTATDEKGQFRLGGLAPGKYRVKANPMNTSLPPEIRSDGTVEVHYAPTYYPNSVTAKGAGQVNVGIGAELGGVGIQLVRIPIVRVSGRVTGAIPGERVMIEAISPNAGARQMGALREDGTFQIWRLDPGKYFVSAFLNASGQNTRTAPVEVEIADSNVDNIELRMIPPFDIAGQVEFEDEQARSGPPPQPAPGGGQLAQQTAPPKPPPLALVLRDTAGRSGASAQVGDDGSFKFENLSPARYRVTLTRGGVYVKSMRLGSTGVDGNLLDLGSGSNGATLSLLVSSATGEISGVVSDDKGPAAQISVTAMPAENEMQMFPTMAISGADGAYKLVGLAPGKYRLTTSADNPWARFQNDDAGDADVIEINRGDKLTRDLKLKPPDGN